MAERQRIRRITLVLLLAFQVSLALFFLVRRWSELSTALPPSPPSLRSVSTSLPAADAEASSPTTWHQTPHLAPVSRRQLEAAIDAAGNYLLDQCTDSGRFIYRVNMDPSVKLSPKYNVLRHAGTMYSLAQYYQWKPRQQTLSALQRSAAYLRQMCIGPVADEPQLLAVWSRPELTHGDHPLKSKLGGAGLSLVALCSIEKIRPGTTPLETLQGLARFVVYMQKPDGSFYSIYNPSQGGRCDKFVSLYYPGEAALGLLMLYDIDPNPQWLQTAAKCLAHLASIREGEPIVPADHWALLATARIAPLLERCEHLSSQQAFAHAAQVGTQMLSEQQTARRAGRAYGGFAGDGRTCPTATRLEGLLATLGISGPGIDAQLRGEMERSASLGVAFLLHAQVNDGPYAGAMPRGAAPLPLEHPQYTRHFNRRVTEVRIDYVQHFLSALIAYWERLDTVQALEAAETHRPILQNNG